MVTKTLGNRYPIFFENNQSYHYDDNLGFAFQGAFNQYRYLEDISQRPFLTVKFINVQRKTHDFDVLIDIGATASVIPKKVVNEIPLGAFISLGEKEPYKITEPLGKRHTIVQRAKLEIIFTDVQNNEHSVPWDFIVDHGAECLDFILLGNDIFWKMFKCIGPKGPFGDGHVTMKKPGSPKIPYAI